MNVLKKSILAMASVALTAGITAGATVSVHADDSPQPEPVYMYRLYNPNSGEHFYTSAQKEKDHLVSVGWRDEGFGWIGCQEPGDPVYRLYNANGGEHHYTMSDKERNALIAQGWKDEGIGWYSYVEDLDSSNTKKPEEPVYREYNPNAFANNHNYTTDLTEHERLLDLGWVDEGVGWYAKYRNALGDITGFNYDASTNTATWNPVKHAGWYGIQFFREADGNGKYDDNDEFVVGDNFLDTPVCTLKKALQAGTYYVFVDSENGDPYGDISQLHYLNSEFLYGDHYFTIEVN